MEKQPLLPTNPNAKPCGVIWGDRQLHEYPSFFWGLSLAVYELRVFNLYFHTYITPSTPSTHTHTTHTHTQPLSSAVLSELGIKGLSSVQWRRAMDELVATPHNTTPTVQSILRQHNIGMECVFFDGHNLSEIVDFGGQRMQPAHG